MNLKTRKVEIKTTATTEDPGALQRSADFVHAFLLGFEIKGELVGGCSSRRMASVLRRRRPSHSPGSAGLTWRALLCRRCHRPAATGRPVHRVVRDQGRQDPQGRAPLPRHRPPVWKEREDQVHHRERNQVSALHSSAPLPFPGPVRGLPSVAAATAAGHESSWRTPRSTSLVHSRTSGWQGRRGGPLSSRCRRVADVLGLSLCRDSICHLILGSPAGKVASKLRTVAARINENY